MSYTKTNWRDGDIITAVKMNKIENGIESSLSDALVTLGKALCGDSFEVESGSTDAETILEIAKNYEGGGSGSGSGSKMIVLEVNDRGVILTRLEPNLPIEYFIGAYFALDDGNEDTPFEYSIVERIEPGSGVYELVLDGFSLIYTVEDGYITMPD